MSIEAVYSGLSVFDLDSNEQTQVVWNGKAVQLSNPEHKSYLFTQMIHQMNSSIAEQQNKQKPLEGTYEIRRCNNG
jgi:hypothetical protein